MTPSLCPKCSAPIAQLDYRHLSANGDGPVLTTLAYACPSCHAVLGVQADPMIMAAKLEVTEAALLQVQKDLAGYVRHASNRALLESKMSAPTN